MSQSGISLTGADARTSHLIPLTDDQLRDVEDVVSLSRQFSGYIPTSLRIMARKPELLRAFAGLLAVVMRQPGEVPSALKWLIAHAVSSAAGCRYCQAHTAANSAKVGLPVEKIEALMTYETNPIYSAAERATVDLALAAGRVPNEASRAHFDALRPHFTEVGIIEIVSVISLFGWLNRWNDTFASDLEAAPMEYASKVLASAGWKAGKHGT
jgi:uncharacterized peroxidase-related enzyme